MTNTRQPAFPPKSSLPWRNDTMLGVCEGLGEDLGIHPNVLRIAFASVFYLAPVAVIATYLGLGLIVAAARYAFPDRAPAAVEAPTVTANDQAELALAA